jgi:hypothetical protein
MRSSAYPTDEIMWAAVTYNVFWCVLSEDFVKEWYPMQELMVGYVCHIQESGEEFSFIGDCLKIEQGPTGTSMDKIFKIAALKLYNEDGTVPERNLNEPL